MTKNTTLFYAFSRYSIFSFFLVGVSLITLVTLLWKGGRRLKFSELEKGAKAKKGDKAKEKKKNHLINEESQDEEDER